MNDLKEAYLTMQYCCGIHIGDTVKVLRKAEDKECGWNNEWKHLMDDCVGKSGIVECITGAGISVSFDGSRWSYPFFILEKIPKPHWRDSVSPENPVLCYVRDEDGEEWRYPVLIDRDCSSQFYRYQNGSVPYKQVKRVPKSMIESMLKDYDETSEDE